MSTTTTVVVTEPSTTTRSSSSSSTDGRTNINHDDPDTLVLLEEWKGFLQFAPTSSSSPQQQNNHINVLLAATEAVTQLHPNMVQQCIQYGFVPLLVKHVSYSASDCDCDNDSDRIRNTGSRNNSNNNSATLEQVSINALRALVYLSSSSSSSATTSTEDDDTKNHHHHQCIHDLITIGKGMNRMMEIVLSNPPVASSSIHSSDNSSNSLWSTRVNYAMALMANMTRTELGVIEFIGHTLPDEPVYHHRHPAPVGVNVNDDENDDETTTTTTTDKSNNHHITSKVKPTLELLLNRFMNPKYVNDENVNYHALQQHTDDNEEENEDDDGDDNSPVTAIIPPMNTTTAADASNSNNNNNNDGSTPNDDTRTTAVEADLAASATLDSGNHDPYQHFAAILLNLSAQSELGRQFIMQIHHHHHHQSPTTGTTTTTKNVASKQNDVTNEWSVLQLVLGQLKSRNPIRRRGIAGMIRNICQHERDSAWWLLNIVQLNIHLLYPLAGPEELDYDDKQGLHVDLWIEGPDKIRESDHITRLFVVETILFLLSTGRVSRNTMRLQRTYVILKMADLVEEYEDVSAIICDCVNYLRRDEDGTADGSSDALIEQTYQFNSKVVPVVSSTDTTDNVKTAMESIVISGDDDFDNVD